MLFYSSQPPSEAGTITPVQRRDYWPLRREVMPSSAPAWQDSCGRGRFGSESY